MQEVFEKIIEKLEEQAKLHMDFSKKENISRENRVEQLIQYSCYRNAIEIVKHEAEQYEECYKHCGECEAYDKEKHHCPKFCKVIKETVKEIEENHNGWIPCSGCVDCKHKECENYGKV